MIEGADHKEIDAMASEIASTATKEIQKIVDIKS
jgi:ribosomal protein S10